MTYFNYTKQIKIQDSNILYKNFQLALMIILNFKIYVQLGSAFKHTVNDAVEGHGRTHSSGGKGIIRLEITTYILR